MDGMKKICNPIYIQYLLYCTLFLIPFSPVALYISLLPAVFLAMGDRTTPFRYGPLVWWGGAFMIFSLCSVCVSPDPAFSLFNWIFEPLMYMAIYVLVLTYLPGEEEKRRALGAMLGGAIVVLLWGVIQYADIGGMTSALYQEAWVDPARFPLLQRRMFSTLENPNLFGAYLLMVISLVLPFFLKEREKKKIILYFIFIFALLICLALTYSRGAWVSVLAMMAALTIFYDKRFGFLFLLLPVVLYFYHGQLTERFMSLFQGEDTSLGLRFALWESTWAMITEHPLLGVGWGSYWLSYPEYNFFIQDEDVIIYHAHNMYLQMPAVAGVPGGLAYLLFFLGHGWIALKQWKRAAGFMKYMGLGGLLLVVSLAVNGISDFALFSRSISFYFWAAVALCLVDKGKQKDNKAE